MTRPTFRLVDLPWSARLGLAALVLVLLGGLAASAAHLFVHHENRDERPGLSLDDLTGAYHGIRTRAPLLVALEAGHPDDLPAAEREGLLAWLGSADLAAGYDDLELGDRAPAEIVDRRCLRCHARQATEGDEIGKRVPLEYWDDVRSLAVSRDVTPTAAEIVLASLHTHALGMGTLSVIAILLACATRWRRGLVGALALLSGLGLALDLAAWLPARDAAFLVPVLALAGGTWISATGALLLLGLVDLLRPGKATADV
jgi:hypothetical protein